MRNLSCNTYNISCLVTNKEFFYSSHSPFCSAPEVHKVSSLVSRQISIQGVGFKSENTSINKQYSWLSTRIYRIVHTFSIHLPKQQLLVCYAYLQFRAGFVLGSNNCRHQVWKNVSMTFSHGLS